MKKSNLLHSVYVLTFFFSTLTACSKSQSVDLAPLETPSPAPAYVYTPTASAPAPASSYTPVNSTGAETVTTDAGTSGTSTSTTTTGNAGNAAAYTQVVTGFEHSCALTGDGRVLCWGGNTYAQIGNGTLTRQWKPVLVRDLSGKTLQNITKLSAGRFHTCAINKSAKVQCWGTNKYNELGKDVSKGSYSSAAVEVPNVVGALELSIGSLASHTCAVISGGALRCWGRNNYGQLGVGHKNVSPNAVTPKNLTFGVVSVTTGLMHSCALLNTGTAYCWGGNNVGQLGNGTTTESLTPKLAGAAAAGGYSAGAYAAGNYKKLVSGWMFTCGLKTDTTIDCWGDNTFNQVSKKTNASFTAPQTQVDSSGYMSLSSYADIAAGDNHVCAVTKKGAVWCWGFGTNGQLGNGTNETSATPVKVLDTQAISTLTNVESIAAGYLKTCAVLKTGQVVCWGSGAQGALGNQTEKNSMIPSEVSSPVAIRN